jgi:hypothetical protein
MYLMQLGFETLIRRGLDRAKREKDNGVAE